MSDENEIQSPRVGRAAPPAKKRGPKPKDAAKADAKNAARAQQDEDHGIDQSARFESQREDSEETPRLTRRSRTVAGTDDYGIPPHLKKKGWDYEFKTSKVNGADVDGADFAFYHEQGWRNVLAKDMPGMLAPGSTAKFIERRGQILMTRPQYLTDEAKAEDYKLAEQQKYDKLQASSAIPIGDRSGKMTATAPEISIEGVVGTHRQASKADAA